MDIIADFLLASGAFGAALYCYILSVRLRRFSTLEGGLGGAIAVLSAQVDDMTRALETARTTAGGSARHLESLTDRAETVAAKLELLVASMHDLPESAPDSDPTGTQTGTQTGEGLSSRRLRVIRRSPRPPLAEALR